MTQRSIVAGMNPAVAIKAGANVTVRGGEGELVVADTHDRWGLKLEKRSPREIGRARAAIGDQVLFDLRLKLQASGQPDAPAEVIDVQFVGGGEVLVPFGPYLKVYAGKDIVVLSVRGRVDAYSGLRLNLQDIYCLGNASAGTTMNLDCQTVQGKSVEYKAGSDLRFHVQDLTSARLRVKDIGGYWEALIGGGEKSVYLKCGGDATLVTDQKVEALPPDYLLGKIERSAAA